MTRTERQQEAIKRWIANKGKGCFEFPTAFGKTFTAITAIKAVLKKYPHLRVLVVVPTLTLKDQWESEIYNHEISFNIEVQVINTVIKHKWECDMLIIDEYHVAGADQMSKVFTCVKYKLILGLTATFERLDGKHELLKRYCPIVDTVTTMEAIANGWISDYKEYQILIDVDDIDTYKEYDKEFFKHFEFFGYDGAKPYNCLGKEGWKYALKLRDEMYRGNDPALKKSMYGKIMTHAKAFQKCVNLRKSFINNHPEKIRIAQKIMKARPNAKIITFNYSIKNAESLENGKYVYTGKTSKNKARVMIEDFLSGKIKHLHSIKKLIEGFNDPSISVAIVLSHDSSERRAVQTRGRVIRKVENKQAEIFNIVINNTQDTKWFSNSHSKNSNYITIDEDGLDKVLRGETPDVYKQKIKDLFYRY